MPFTLSPPNSSTKISEAFNLVNRAIKKVIYMLILVVKKKLKFIKSKKKPRERKVEVKSLPRHIYLGEFDRITYIYNKDLDGNYTKVVNVSYEIFIDQKWQLVSRYDSEHNHLHCHMTISVKNKSEIALPISRVIKKGKPKDWLTWAIKDIESHFFEYRKGFLKRSKIAELY